MKKRSVQRAYQNIRPDEESKARMLQNILLSSEIPPAGKDDTMKHKKMKPMVIAAIIALMVMLMGCAIVAMTLQDLKIGEHTYKEEAYIDDFGNYVGETEFVRDMISLQGIKDSPNQKAAQEWLEFEDSYDVDGQKIGDAEAAGYVTPREYDAYFVYDQIMQDKVDEIIQKYGLKLAGMGAYVQKYQSDIFFDALGFEDLHHEDTVAEVEYLSGYFYACGNFNMEFWLTLPDGADLWPHEILTNIRYNGKEYLDTVFTSIANMETVEQWHYTTADGMDILIIMGEDFARFFCDREDAFLTSGFGTDYESDSGEIQYMTKADVEAVADALDFGIVPQKPDMDAVTELLEQSKKEHTVKPSQNENATFEDCIAHQIAKLEDKATEMFYHLADLDDDGEAELILGDKNEIDTVWMMIDGTAQLIVDYGENYQKLKEAWPTMEKESITEFYVNANGEVVGNSIYQTFIENRIEVLEHPENLYFILTDLDQNGIVDLLLGSKDKCDAVWTITYDEHSETDHMNFLPMTDEEWAELDQAWPGMDKKPITEYGVTSTNQDKYGYQRYIDEVLSMEHPENTLYVLSDINNDGVQELLIGDHIALAYVFRVSYSKNGYANIEVLSASMTEDELNALKAAWPDMDRKPVTEYYSG